MIRQICLIALFVCSLSLTFASIRAGEPQSKLDARQHAERLVQEALYNEMYGDLESRQRLLAQAAQVDPDNPGAMWHRGYVFTGKAWVKASDLVLQSSANKKLQEYETRKADMAGDIQQHLNAANWCRKHDLLQQERAHLEAILLEDPSQVQVHQRLGHQLVQGRWVTGEQVQQMLDQARLDRQNLTAWRDRLNKIADGLHDKNVTIRKRAEVALMEIRDPAAIMPMELLLSSIDESTCSLVVQTLSAIPDQEASFSLARHAIFAPYPSVRQQAAVALRNCDPFTFVPQILGALQTEVVSMRWLTLNEQGQLIFRHQLAVETQDTKQFAIQDSVYTRVNLGGNQANTTERALSDIRGEFVQNMMRTEALNNLTREFNQRAISVLTIATEQEIGNDPRDWWQWWDEQTDTLTQSKRTLVEQQTQNVSVVDSIPSSLQSAGSGGSSQVSGSFSCECLTAGTQILTSNGLRSIEKMTVGDLVLSKNSLTGELTFKPVIRTTIRPAAKLVSVELENETIRCSQGHPFWVSGQGWLMARELQAGMSLHTSDGLATIKSVASSGEEDTYNLIVADFHTYFVGDHAILSHDVTMREPAEVAVPGSSQ
jgi:hypothetical protein